MDTIINVYKPSGMTSFKCVAAVRKILNTKKVGHAGTLDPEASGVLPICVGKATKLLEFFLLCRKSYRGNVMFGISTDTQDIWGQRLSSGDPSMLTDSMLQEAASHFTGAIEQIPPAYSAIKIDGVPMYQRARKGEAEDVILEPRSVNVYSLELSHLRDTVLSDVFNVPVREAQIDVECSRGTYVRTLCYDIGRRLEVPSCMSYLCRKSYGPFSLNNAVTLEELEDAAKAALEYDDMGVLANGKIVFYDPDYILANFPVITLNNKQMRCFRNGQTVEIEGTQLRFGTSHPLFPTPDKGIARLKFDNKLVGVVRFFVGTDLQSRDALMVRPWKFIGGDCWDAYCKKL